MVIFMLTGTVAQAQITEDTKISLLTCRPGDEIYNSFGHTAIRVQDQTKEIDIIYNYGLFSFSEPGFVMKFLRGKLNYWLGTERYLDFVNNYSEQKRSVIEQELNLSVDQKRKIFNALQENMRPENRRYQYDFFFDNCSTRPRDLIMDNIPLKWPEESQAITFRSMLDIYLQGKPWTDFGIDLIIGSGADSLANTFDQMFLPEFLMDKLDAAQTENQSLVSNTRMLVDYESMRENRNSSTVFTPLFVAFVFLFTELMLFLGIGKKNEKILRINDKVFFGLFGLGGLIIMFMWFGTDHEATSKNMNLLWLNPLFLLLLFKRSPKVIWTLMVMLVLALSQSIFIQYLHPASILLIVFVFLKLLRYTAKEPLKS